MEPVDVINSDGNELLGPIKTIPFLSKFEKARVLGIRALQISHGAAVNFDPEDTTDPLEIAEKELECGECPLILRRYLPDGTYEDVSVSYFMRKKDH